MASNTIATALADAARAVLAEPVAAEPEIVIQPNGAAFLVEQMPNRNWKAIAPTAVGWGETKDAAIAAATTALVKEDK